MSDPPALLHLRITDKSPKSVASPVDAIVIKSIKRGKEYTLGVESDIPINTQLKFNKIRNNAKVKIDDGKLSFRVVKKITASKIDNIAFNV